MTEAARARYAWLEMLSLRDLLRWCGEGDAAGVRLRLSGVAGRLVASPEELSGVVGEGVLLPAGTPSTSAVVAPSMEVAVAEYGLAMIDSYKILALANMTRYDGPVTHDKVVQSFKHLQDFALHCSNAAAAASDAVHQLECWAALGCSIVTSHVPCVHALPEFSAEAMLGKNGARLRDTIER